MGFAGKWIEHFFCTLRQFLLNWFGIVVIRLDKFLFGCQVACCHEIEHKLHFTSKRVYEFFCSLWKLLTIFLFLSSFRKLLINLMKFLRLLRLLKCLDVQMLFNYWHLVLFLHVLLLLNDYWYLWQLFWELPIKNRLIVFIFFRALHHLEV